MEVAVLLDRLPAPLGGRRGERTADLVGELTVLLETPLGNN
ncbi:hypothetical protein [Kribbella jejuensis]|nr:hypothetical protein [Kribbella jejuensis]